MEDFLSEYYLWIRSFHLIAVIAWMAGLLYLPRLFVYHAAATPGSELSETLKTMERRLLRAIMNPAMIAVYIFGILLFFTPGIVSLKDGWFHAKITLVIILTIFHHLLARWRKSFEKDSNPYSQRFYRYMNEVPTLCMIGIVIMVIVKPF